MSKGSLADTTNGKMAADWAEWQKFATQAQQARAEGNHSFAEYLWMAAVAEAEVQNNDLRLPMSLDGLAESFWHQGKLRQAEIAARRAFELYEQLLPHDHLDIGVAANNLAMIFHWQQKYGQAEPLYKQSLEIKTKHLGGNHPDVASVVSHYARLLQETQRETEAAQLRMRIDAIKAGKGTQTAGGAPNALNLEPRGYAPTTLAASPGLVTPVSQADAHGSHQKLADVPKALDASNLQVEIEFLRKKVEEYEATIKKQDFQIQELIARIPKQPDNGRSPDTGQHSRTPETPAQPAHKMTWDTTMKEAKAAFDGGRYEEANSFLQNAMILATEFGDQDPRRTVTLDALGECLFREEKFGQAEIILQRSLSTKRQNLGNFHKDVTASANNLARLHYHLSRFQEAEFLANKCVEIHAHIFGDKSLEVASSAQNLATLYHVQGQYSMAEKAYKKALDIRSDILGPNHPDTVVLRKNYADLLAVTGRTDEAGEYDGTATGLISGSWKTIQIDQAISLEE